MDPRNQLDDAEIAAALLGQPASERLPAGENAGTEFAEWAALGDALRRQVRERADMPPYFWTRQQARIRERTAPRRRPLGWVALATAALLLAATGLLTQRISPTLPPHTNAQNPPIRQLDSDDALLQDIQASLQSRVPAPLMPASLLVQEVTRGFNTNSEVKEN